MQSLQYSTAFYVAFGAMAVLLVADGRLNDSLFFMAVGMLTSFVDFLTYPIATLGLPLVLHTNCAGGVSVKNRLGCLTAFACVPAGARAMRACGAENGSWRLC